MRPRTLWPEDPIFIEIGVRDADLACGLRREGYRKYLGVSGNASRIALLQAQHPELADQLTCSRHRKLVANNNAEVLILSGRNAWHLWKYRSVRHAHCVAWRFGWNLLSLVALVGCLGNMLAKRYGWPSLVTLRTERGATRRLLVCRVLRQKDCRRKSLHFIPHSPGLAGLFRQFDEEGVRYVVLRWFESLPKIKPTEDVDLLVADDSLDVVRQIFNSQPGIQPCDLYSESGLARSTYCGTPYYPPHVARRILDGAVRHQDLCLVPNAWDYFHSLAYHAVYHKGLRSNLPRSGELTPTVRLSQHNYGHALRQMASRLGIEVEISLEGLHAYLRNCNCGPSPEMLARLAVACRDNKWLRELAQRLEPHLHDQGLVVFVLRQEAVERGYQDRIMGMIERSGFEILATKLLSSNEIEFSAARTRGGNWDEDGLYNLRGGPPAAVVVAYDRQPLPLSRRQRKKFTHRTNARIFVKESIREAIVAELPRDQRFNALHSSDHAADAWHLIEVLAPEIVARIQDRLRQIHAANSNESALRRAA